MSDERHLTDMTAADYVQDVDGHTTRWLPKTATAHNADAFIDDRLQQVIAIMRAYPDAAGSLSLRRELVRLLRRNR